MEKITAPFAFAFLLILGLVILALMLAWPTQWLWNTCLVPTIDAVNAIGFWQAFGLNVLFSIMFNKNTVNPNKSKK